jgi:TRAP-type C4-dicarboxylate transport system substrate-binding protein
MTTIELKENLTEIISHSENQDLLEWVYVILQEAEKDWWQELPNQVREDIDKALSESQQKNYISNSDVKKQYYARF